MLSFYQFFIAKRLFAFNIILFDRIKNNYEFDYTYLKDGLKIPIYKDYRYRVKLGWGYFNSLNSLNYLFIKKLLSSSEISFFKASIGSKTLEKPLEEINFFANNVAKKHKNFFIESSLNSNEGPIIKETKESTLNKISFFKTKNKFEINFLNSLKLNKKDYINSSSKILEIGYVSGGHSIIAFEKIGLQSFGIDNFYSNMSENNMLWKNSKTISQSKASFMIGDITKKNADIEPGKFDIIYSRSTLEHILDIDASFIEMYRLLKPKGIIYHHYNPLT